MAYTIESLVAMLPSTVQLDQAKGVDTVVQLNVTGSEAGQWNIVIKDGKATVAKGVHAAPELTVTADTADVLAVANGQLDPAKAVMEGKVKVSGNPMEALGLMKMFKPK